MQYFQIKLAKLKSENEKFSDVSACKCLLFESCDCDTARKGVIVTFLTTWAYQQIPWKLLDVTEPQQIPAVNVALSYFCLIEDFGRNTTGPTAFSRIIRKSLIKCAEMPVIKFEINSEMYVPLKQDLSTDQL